MGNILSRQRNELFAPMYQQSVYPANNMLTDAGENKAIDRTHFINTQMETIQRLKSSGIIESTKQDNK